MTVLCIDSDISNLTQLHLAGVQAKEKKPEIMLVIRLKTVYPRSAENLGKSSFNP